MKEKRSVCDQFQELWKFNSISLLKYRDSFLFYEIRKSKSSYEHNNNVRIGIHLKS